MEKGVTCEYYLGVRATSSKDAAPPTDDPLIGDQNLQGNAQFGGGPDDQHGLVFPPPYPTGMADFDYPLTRDTGVDSPYIK
jgi:hypothetical protein